LQVICKDALKTEFPQFDLVVANIPYGISSPLVAKLAYGASPFRSATLLLQKEFARRLLANPGDSEFNRLAVNVKLVADVELVMDVSKRDFVPCPKVDSSVVIIRPKAEVPDVNLDEWWAFTRTCFSKKRKVLDLLRISRTSCSNGESTSNDSNYDCSNDAAAADNDEEEVDSDEEDMPMTTVFRKKILGVLNSGGFEDKRPSKLSNEELLHLLALFNQAGIYFHDHSKSRDADNVKLAAALSS
jgi:18S rRNA (adenine1779-N6/adenine1780-N6)-dimethyltransferase